MGREKTLILYLGGFAILAAMFRSKKAIGDLVTTKSDNFYAFDHLFRASAAKYGVNWLHLKALAWNESSVGNAASVKRGLASPSDREGSKSADGLSWGIMQLTIPTARDYYPTWTHVELNDPAKSIECAARHWARILKKFGGDISRAAAAYNQGEGNEAKGYRSAPVVKYIADFLSHLEQLKERHQ